MCRCIKQTVPLADTVGAKTQLNSALQFRRGRFRHFSRLNSRDSTRKQVASPKCRSLTIVTDHWTVNPLLLVMNYHFPGTQTDGSLHELNDVSLVLLFSVPRSVPNEH
jgi:hypothetical protein